MQNNPKLAKEQSWLACKYNAASNHAQYEREE